MSKITPQQEKRIVRLYQADVPSHEICRRVFPLYQPEDTPRGKALRYTKVNRILRRLGVAMRTASDRRRVGNPAFVKGMKRLALEGKRRR